MAIIPKIRKGQYSKPETILTIVEDIDIGKFPDAVYYLDFDLEDQKDKAKYIKLIKSYIRRSLEYSDMMGFLKNYRKMNRCFYLPKIRQYHGSKTKIEIHHAPFTMFDIIETVIRKRMKEKERLFPSDIAQEVMELHYAGKIGLVSLSTTTHELIHSENTPQDLFVPLQNLDFGNPDLFFNEYDKYMDRDLSKKYKKIQTLSKSITNLDDIVPDYLSVQRVYYKLDDNYETQFPIISKVEEILSGVA